jgi:hypothetical protein
VVTTLNHDGWHRIKKWVRTKTRAELDRTPSLPRVLATVAKHGWEGGPNIGDPPLARDGLADALVRECYKWAGGAAVALDAEAYHTGDGT